jgi:putative transposase
MRLDRTTMVEALRRVVKRRLYPLEVMRMCVRWYAAYPLSFRNIEEMTAERGVFVEHSTLHRWSIKMLPVLAATLRRRKRPVGSRWRIDETYVQVAGHWQYRYRAVDRDGDTVDFLLPSKRDHAAARTFFERAMDLHGVPEKITIDKSGANTAAITSIQADSGLPIVMRQSKDFNNIVEQDQRVIKRVTRPMLGCKTFGCARLLVAGVEVMHMIRKGPLGDIKDQTSSVASQFYSLAF